MQALLRTVLMLLALVGAADAATTTASPATSATNSLAVLLRSATHGQVTFDRAFDGPAPDIQGVIGHVENDPVRRVLLWVVGGRYLVDGALINSVGADLSRQAAITDGLIPKPMPAMDLAAQAARARGFVLGHAGPLILAFEDPNCSACHMFSSGTAKALSSGKLRVRVIPVGFLKPDSAARAATILAAHDPARAWLHNEAAFDVAREEGGLPVGRFGESDARHVASNTALLNRSGAIVTPTIVYCDRAVGTPAISRGWNPSVMSRLGPMRADGRCAMPAAGSH
jgi:thiol:disulfide interchange protein DsbG